jgi:hypothetical protein
MLPARHAQLRRSAPHGLRRARGTPQPARLGGREHQRPGDALTAAAEQFYDPRDQIDGPSQIAGLAGGLVTLADGDVAARLLDHMVDLDITELGVAQAHHNRSGDQNEAMPRLRMRGSADRIIIS